MFLRHLRRTRIILHVVDSATGNGLCASLLHNACSQPEIVPSTSSNDQGLVQFAKLSTLWFAFVHSS